MSHAFNDGAEDDALIPVADDQAVGLGVGRRSVGRRIKNPPPGFPLPLRINGRLYFRRSELKAYKQRLIEEALAARSARAPRTL
jgi:hypothetical protein